MAALDGNLLVTGGRGTASSSRGRDVWGTLDGETWSPFTVSAAWPARQSHAMATLAGEAWLLGGYTGSARLNDAWHSEDGVQWQRAVPANSPWVPRGDLGVVSWQDRLWVIGGHNFVNSTNTYYGDVWSGTLMPFQRHSADVDGGGSFSLSELLRVIQLYNSTQYGCEPETEDGYAPNDIDRECAPHSSDYSPQDWAISVSELLRVIQFYNLGGYVPCSESEDGYCSQGN
jgi:hypothetical protein